MIGWVWFVLNCALSATFFAVAVAAARGYAPPSVVVVAAFAALGVGWLVEAAEAWDAARGGE